MSKLDFPTILILAICIAAIIFLGYKMFDLMGKKATPVETPTELTTEEEEEPTNESEDDIYNYDLEEDSTGVADSDSENAPTESEDINYAEDDEPAEASVPASYNSNSSGKYMVLAGAFKIKANAEQYANKLKARGYSDAAAHIFDKGSIAVVLVDRFENYDDAKTLVGELKRKGIDAYVQNYRASAN